MKEQIILVGGGGHCRSCIDVIECEGRFEIAGIVDVKDRIGEKILDYTIIGSDDDLPALIRKYKNVLITIGYIKSPSRRIEAFDRIIKCGGILPVIQSPTARVSRHAGIQSGSIIMHHAVINACSQIGHNCIINTSAIVEHDTRIGDHCHISTGSVVNGTCTVGDMTFIGSNTTIKNNTDICSEVQVGCGSNVIHTITRPGIYAGNPARQIG